MGYEPFINIVTEKFTRGQHEGSTIQEVAESDDEGIGYLYFVMDYANTDQESKYYVAEWLEIHPEYQEE